MALLPWNCLQPIAAAWYRGPGFCLSGKKGEEGGAHKNCVAGRKEADPPTLLNSKANFENATEAVASELERDNSMSHLPPTTKGYAVGEVVSALQKEIRRGKEVDALFWALEMCPRYEAYMWRRLLVIVHEDIGVANPQLLQLVPEMRRAYFEFRAWSKDGSAQMVLTNAIVLMCRSPKSRLGDEMKTWLRDEREHGMKLKVPDYALDKHTGAGKRKGRGFDHWIEEGCVLIPPPEPENSQYHDRAVKTWKQGALKPNWGGKATVSKAYRPEPDQLTPLFREEYDPDDEKGF